MSKIVWNINNFVWEQDSAYLWQAWWFQSALWVDLRKEPPFVKLASAMTLEWTFDSPVIYMKNLEEFWLTWILICLENGKIYLNWTLQHTLTDWTSAYNKIKWVWFMKSSWTNYLYYFSKTSSWIWKIYKSAASVWALSDTWDTFDVEAGNTNIPFYPILSEATRLVLWLRNKVFEYDNVETLRTKIELWWEETIVWITEFQNNYKIYSTVYSTLWITGKQYFWDWLDTDYDYSINWNNLPIWWIAQNGAYDYAVTWYNSSYSDFYEITWSQRTPKRVNLESSSWTRQFQPYLWFRSDICYISWANKEWIQGIFSYGNYYPWYDKWLVLEYAKSTTSDSNYFTHQAHSTNKSYFACVDNKVYSVLYLNPTTPYFNNGYVITKKWIWNWLHTLKSVDYMYVWYKLEVWTSISIYARPWDWNWAFGKLLKTISITTETPATQKWIRIEANEFQSVDLWDFYEIELKFVLSTTDTTKTPALWPIMLFCNDNYNK